MDNRIKRNQIFTGFINFTIYSYLLFGIIFLVVPKNVWPELYSPIFFGLTSLFISSLLLGLKRFVKVANLCEEEALMFLRLSLSFAFVMNGLGELYFYQLYKLGFQYDKIIHLLIPFIFIISITSFCEVIFKYSLKKSLFVSAMLVLLGSFGWELFEYLSDLFFDTKEFGVYGLYKFSDTAFDLVFDSLGIIIGVIFLKNAKLYKIIVSGYCQGK